MCSGLGPRHPRFRGERHPAPVARVQPQSLLQDLGRQQRPQAHAPVSQRLLGALGRRQHVAQQRGTPQVAGAGTHQERVGLLGASQR